MHALAVEVHQPVVRWVPDVAAAEVVVPGERDVAHDRNGIAARSRHDRDVHHGRLGRVALRPEGRQIPQPSAGGREAQGSGRDLRVLRDQHARFSAGGIDGLHRHEVLARIVVGHRGGRRCSRLRGRCRLAPAAQHHNSGRVLRPHFSRAHRVAEPPLGSQPDIQHRAVRTPAGLVAVPQFRLHRFIGQPVRRARRDIVNP